MVALEGTEYDSAVDSADEDGDRRKRGIIAAILLFLLFLLLFWWVFSRYAVVPDVVGLAEQQAIEMIESAGFVVGEVLERPSVEGRAGEVVGQSPDGGTRALKGSPVDIFVAEREDVPDDVDVRRPGIDELGLEWGAPTERPRPIEPPRVTDTRPRVPQALGLTEAEGTRILRNAGYRVTVEYGASTTDVPQGRIFFQDPAPDTVAARGTTVSVWVSTGSPRPGQATTRPQPPKPAP